MTFESPKFVIKTLLKSFTVKKLAEYRSKFQILFREVDPIYDEIFDHFEDFYKSYDTIPTSENILDNLELAGHSKEAQYFRELMEDPLVVDYKDEADFFNALEQAETDKTLQEACTSVQKMQLGLAQRQVLGLKGIAIPMDDLLVEIHRLKSRIQRSEGSTASYLGRGGVNGTGTSLEEIYAGIKSKSKEGRVFFNCGLKAFEDVNFKDGDLVFIGAYTSHGKALSCKTIIPTPTGWTTMGDLKVGDTIFSDLGEQCQVIGATEVMYDRPCYRVTFSDGSEIIADESHQWFTWTARDRLNDKRQTLKWRVAHRGKSRITTGTRPDMVFRNQSRIFEDKIMGSVNTTKEIMDTLLGPGGRLNHSIPVCNSLQCEHVDLPINSYLLGAWLGDGTSRAAEITIAESEMVELVEEAAKIHQWRVTRHKSLTRFGIVGGMKGELRKLGILGKGRKAVPQIYMRSSIEQRLALVQGLMDTDGYVSSIGDCEFVTIYENLAKSMAELVRSLGGKVNIRESNSKLYGRVIGKKYRLIFSPIFEAFRLSRKAKVLDEANAKKGHKVAKNQKHYIKSVEPIKSVPVRCIEIDSPSKLFLCGDRMVSTHNSIFLRHNAYRQAVYYGRNVAFFTKEMTHDACRVLFSLTHANNKELFPGTPYIESDKVFKGTLNPEEEDFYFTADRDLTDNPIYGYIYIDQPNKSRYRLSDLDAKLTEIESFMPVHCVVYDYITLIYPLESDKAVPQRNDTNEMIASFKNMLLIHRNARGVIAPMLGFTAAKLSRSGLTECLKNNGGVYEMKAFYEFTEIEFSSDHLFTALLTSEMKAANRIRFQNLKNRMGAVIQDPYDAYIDLKHGLTLHDTDERSEEEVREILTGISLT